MNITKQTNCLVRLLAVCRFTEFLDSFWLVFELEIDLREEGRRRI
jgi:hypothetical protein